jgi:hypothetical protein
VAVAHSDEAAYLRGKAHLGGLRDDTPLSLACDIILALEVDGIPGEQLKKWRSAMDRQLMVRASKPGPSGPDRATWGLQPGQAQAMGKLTSGMKLPPGVVPTPLR